MNLEQLCASLGISPSSCRAVTVTKAGAVRAVYTQDNPYHDVTRTVIWLRPPNTTPEDQ